MSDIVTTKYWHEIEDGRIQCDLCPRLCKLQEGQRGLCFVRACQERSVVLTTYGRSSSFCVDPIEKKPLNQFFPGTSVLSFGTAGCNLSCQFCQNWDISKSREMRRLSNEASPEKIARVAQNLGCKSVAFTYNDPVIFMEYAIDVAQACHERGIASVAVSAGYICEEPREEFYKHIDAANIDLKAFTERFYKNICAGHLEPVLETLKYIQHETDVWLELTNLIIPGENDTHKELDQMTSWVAEELGPNVPMHFTAFHPDWKMLTPPRTSRTILTKARRLAMENGLRYAYTGNIRDQGGGSTYCHNCEQRLIERDWYELGEWHLAADGSCDSCGTTCAGVFDEKPGNWGGQRRPVQLHDVE